MSDLKTEKRCSGCNCIKSIDNFGRHSRDGYRSRCKQCCKELRKAGLWSKGSADSIRAAAHRSYMKNAEVAKERTREWRRVNPDRYTEHRRRYLSENSQKLSDSYVRHRLAERTAVDAKYFPQALVDAKREQLRLLRALKGMI